MSLSGHKQGEQRELRRKEMRQRKMLAFEWLSSVADSPFGWGTSYLDSLRHSSASGLSLLYYVESLAVFQDWATERRNDAAAGKSPPFTNAKFTESKPPATSE